MIRRKALVTGGGSGLGEAAAQRLRADGLEVVTVDLRGADVAADVTDQESLARIVTKVGPVDVLVNSAGVVGPNRPLIETTADEWRDVFEVNVIGTVNTIRAFAPAMCERGWGRVVNIASMAGKDGNPNLSVYSASKARGHRADEVGRQGTRHQRCPGQCHRSGRHRDADERQHRAGRTGAHHESHPDEAGRPARGGGRAGGVPLLRASQLLDRRGLRHQRRAGDLLSVDQQLLHAVLITR
ncbi:SDR family NAD(P)-dependent oxidoreductase [Kribbella qitaiheensis]|uniref:SDR family NAD(P)-dependent oxidoreductase n=1 Tax=Kribbella qitaiheensis TaxID=1544730 RepID=UPI0019D6777A|nr:SDR family NAD(P)-dependent oxidoreductase [Kribbella qitaiheensis]